ncbi:MAG: SMP-30/gluconolactonase/LRE family protein [Verrucomicrobia bacterium]|nr:SMP-30/gluconolactonase/LRE family protein [Verrucomicrobiota bacterium]MCH8513165.1 SMP-30/gluconolactonase/LRE family protein [Kiritimatiellia bacterium]
MKKSTVPEHVGSRVSAWGEGPVWWRDCLHYVDIKGGALISWNPQTDAEEVFEVGQEVGFLLPCGSGAWVWGGEKGLYLLDSQTRASTLIASPEADKPNNRFNDAGVSPDGRLFAGTIAMDKTTGAANLYRVDQNLRCEVAYPQVTNSNGIAWSPDGRVCYYIDTPTRKVLRFQYRGTTGALEDPQVLLDTDPVIDASPDGMCVDAEGHLWIAFCHGGCVIRFDHVSGRELQRIEFPCVETTSCCFGGPDLRDLYVTTGIHANKTEAQAGKVFVVKDVGVGGLPQVPFGADPSSAIEA